MKHKKFAEALNEVDDRYIAEAVKGKKRRKLYWVSAAAAMLALTLAIGAVARPVISVKALSKADYSQSSKSHYQEIHGCVQTLSGFFTDVISQILSDSHGENQVFSPANLYMGLSALTELTGGDEELLALLQAEDLDALRKQTELIWNMSRYEEKNPVLLASSVWLDEDLKYNQQTMDILAQHHYTSVYQGDFGTGRTNRAISAWLNRQTGNLLKDTTDNISLDPSTVFALYSTIYFQAKWSEEFNSSKNTKGVFHAAGGDKTATFMNKENMWAYYYWGEDFSAVSLSLKGNQMWIILPDKGKTADDVLSGEEYGQMLFGDYRNSKYMKVILSLPKFDIRSSGDLKEDLQVMGVTDIFDREKADFSAALNTDGPVWLASVNQATRVAIDEEGVTAASYIEFPGATSPAPPEEVIEFIVDRPFIFVVTNNWDIPLFAGVVNEP